MIDFKQRMEEYRLAVEDYLNGCFTDDAPQKCLFEAMRYSGSDRSWFLNFAAFAAGIGKRLCRLLHLSK